MSESTLFPPSLVKLLALQGRGFVRRTFRNATSPRRAVFLIIGLGTMMLWFGSVIASQFGLAHAQVDKLATITRFRQIAPLALCGICLLTIVSSATDRAIAFTAGEVDILFPGPFTRRNLLAFKLLKSGIGAMVTSLLVTIPMASYGHSLPASYVGVFLSLLFVQLFSTAGVLLGQTLGQRFYRYLRNAVIIALLAGAAIVTRSTLQQIGGIDGLLRFSETDLGQAILRPFQPFALAISAGSVSEFLLSAGEAVAIDLGLVAVVMMLDANYLEAAMGASQRRYAQIQRIRGGQLIQSRIKGSVNWTLPRLPFLGGVGPIVWRQATSAARSARGLLTVLLIIAIGAGPAVASIGATVNPAKVLFPALVWATVLLSGLMKYDFRGDLDHFDALKSMPLRSAPLAIGQLIVPTIVLTSFHVIALVGAAVMMHTDRELLIAAALLALPFNALLTAADNLLFLLFPARPVASSPGDFQMMGRQTAQIVAKGIVTIVGCSIAAAIAVPVFMATGSYILLVAIAGTLLLVETCAMIPLIAWAYNRFDPSVDTPA